MSDPVISLTVTWTPAETALTEIASYDILRSVDGGPYTLLINCPVIRDFLGGLLGVRNCFLPVASEDPGNPYVRPPGDYAQPISYIDDDVEVGREYCYQIQANPQGNNQYNDQGPPCVSLPACSTFALLPPDLTGSYDATDAQVVLVWGLPADEFFVVTAWQVYRSIDAGAYTLLASPAANALSMADATVSTGHTYSYYVTYSVGTAVSTQSTPVAVTPA